MNTRWISLAALALLLGGCASSHNPTTMPELTQPMIEEPEPLDNPGSLFSANGAEYLYDDNRATRVGDIVMVVVSETTSAKNKAETTANREGTMDIGATAIPQAGLGALATRPLGLTAGAQFNTTNKNDFSGTGETKRDSYFTTTVATRIVRMLPGRVMQVEGARQIRVNDENQILVVRGLVRQRDIASDNTVPSSNLAQAQIEVYGEGIVADKQKPGWLTRILDNLWPY